MYIHQTRKTVHIKMTLLIKVWRPGGKDNEEVLKNTQQDPTRVNSHFRRPERSQGDSGGGGGG